MEETEQGNKDEPKRIHPREKANFLSRFFFLWQIPFLFKKDNKEYYVPLEECDSQLLAGKLEDAWVEEESSRKDPSLWRAYFKVFGLRFMIFGVLTLIMRLVLILFQPYVFGKLLDYFTPNQNQISHDEGALYILAMVLLLLFQIVVFHSTLASNNISSLKIRIATSGFIYRKCLNMNKGQLGQISNLGQIVNFFSNDAMFLERGLAISQYVWTSPIEVIVTAFFIYFQIGYSGLVGVATILLFCFLQLSICKKAAEVRLRSASQTDSRLQIMNEIICGMQIIKMYSWEWFFDKAVKVARDSEIKEIKTLNYLQVYNASVQLFLINVALFLSVVVAMFIGDEINLRYIFVAYTYFNIMKTSATIYMPAALAMIAITKGSVERIKTFFVNCGEHNFMVNNLKTLNPGLFSYKVKPNKMNYIGVSGKNLVVKWARYLDNITLNDIDFEASTGNLVAVIGAAGSGKSALLQTILGETCVVEGNLEVNGKISYASQEPWIFPASVKQNILFNEKMDEEKYSTVIRVCGLKQDISMFPYGDLTLVGERGVMLSGGQKARINLARAIYRNADIYLLDDPLSAVDSHVANHIFDKCITDYLKDKCVILVTHQVHFLKDVEQIYILQAGKIVDRGSYIRLSRTQTLYKEQLEKEPIDVKELETVPLKKYEIPTGSKESNVLQRQALKVLGKYFLAGASCCTNIFLCFLFIMTQLTANASDYFLTFWVGLNQSDTNPDVKFNTSAEVSMKSELDETRKFLTTENFLYIYLSVVLLIVIFTCARAYLFVEVCIRASVKLHSTMFNKVLHGTMQFFNTHPSGRILNRFSRDIGLMDSIHPLNITDTFQIFLMAVIVVVLVVALNYFLIIPSVIFLGILGLTLHYFLKTLSTVRMQDTITRSPIYTHLAASVQGLTTLRALDAKESLIREFDEHQNRNAAAFFLEPSLTFVLGFWIDFFCVLYLIVMILCFYCLQFETGVGSIGLIIMEIITLVNVVQIGAKFSNEVNMNLVAVERIQEYTDLTTEDDNFDCKPADSWPNEGKITFQNLSLQYAPTEPMVLKNINIRIKPKEKIGIVGRTGSGKSSLISTIFRLYEFEGHIIIDGLDTKRIQLSQLRSKIAIIPQDPVLFKGTLRKNLDPFSTYADAEIWAAVEEVEMKAAISGLSNGLESLIEEGGSNFSTGERQLLCLIRAILRNCKILILDEVTANVDLKTDQIIQSTIRKKFKNSTVLTIAHRLHTVMDSDKILVLNGGHVVEFDHPYYLLQKSDGFLYNYVTQNGNEVAQELISIANKNFHEKLA